MLFPFVANLLVVCLVLMVAGWARDYIGNWRAVDVAAPRGGAYRHAAL
jgi:hypothetical protein